MLIQLYFGFLGTDLKDEIRCLARACVRHSGLTTSHASMNQTCSDNFTFLHERQQFLIMSSPLSQHPGDLQTETNKTKK